MGRKFCVTLRPQLKHTTKLVTFTFTNEPQLDKTNKMSSAPSKDRSAWASAQSDQSSLSAQWVARDARFLHADSEDSDQTGLMPSWSESSLVAQVMLLVLSCHGSNDNFHNSNALAHCFSFYYYLAASVTCLLRKTKSGEITQWHAATYWR